MEIIIAIAVFGFALWWFFLRTPADTTPPVLYKVETPPTPEPTPVVEVKVEEPAPVVEVVTTPVVEAVEPAKKPRKPRAPKAVAEPVKAAVKKAAPVKKAAVKKPAARSVVKSKKV